MMLRMLLGVFLAYMASSCSTLNREQKIGEAEDFSIDSQQLVDRQGELRYHRDVQRSFGSVKFNGSFPVAISVGKSSSPFDQTPASARSPDPASLELKIGACRMLVTTSQYQVSRFLYTGDWVRFGREHRSGFTIALEPNSDLNIRISSQLQISISDQDQAVCRKLLEGRAFALGGFHFDYSEAKVLLNVEKAVSMTPFLGARNVKVAYFRWLTGDHQPWLLNELGFPVTVDSPMYRAQFGLKGYYFISFVPRLELIKSHRLIQVLPQKAVAKIK